MILTKQIIVQEEVISNVVQVVQTIESYVNKKVSADIIIAPDSLSPKSISLILWEDIEANEEKKILEDLAYTRIGQYTDTEIEKRINELLCNEL